MRGDHAIEHGRSIQCQLGLLLAIGRGNTGRLAETRDGVFLFHFFENALTLRRSWSQSSTFRKPRKLINSPQATSWMSRAPSVRLGPDFSRRFRDRIARGFHRSLGLLRCKIGREPD